MNCARVDAQLRGQGLSPFSVSSPQATTSFSPCLHGTQLRQGSTDEADTTAPLDTAGITRLHEIIGTLLFYAHTVNSTMLVALGTLTSAQSKGTEAMAQAATQL